MADPKQIEQELMEYLEREPNLRRDDRIVYLMKIMNKHFDIDKINHTMSFRDFTDVISNAKSSFATKRMPIVISNQRIEGMEANYILMIEAFVGYLNKHKLLKRLVKLDYTR